MAGANFPFMRSLLSKRLLATFCAKGIGGNGGRGRATEKGPAYVLVPSS